LAIIEKASFSPHGGSHTSSALVQVLDAMFGFLEGVADGRRHGPGVNPGLFDLIDQTFNRKG